MEEEQEISRMNLAEYKKWSDENWCGTEAQISESAEALYAKLTENLHLQVISSPPISMAGHMMLVIEEGRKFPSIDHVYHFANTHLPHAEKRSITTVISVERLGSEFAIVLADLIENLVKEEAHGRHK